MANLWDELDDDTAESRAAKGLKQIAQATLDSGPMPKAGSEEFASGKAEPSADLMDIIPVEKAALTGAAGAAKVASLIKGAALAKAGASKPALGALALGAIKSVANKEAKELPMDLASRMARAEKMGFTEELTIRGKPISNDWYHGTGSNIEGFDPSLLGANTTGPSKGLGVHLSKAPELANEYAKESAPEYLKRATKAADIAIDDVGAAQGDMIKKYGSDRSKWPSDASDLIKNKTADFLHAQDQLEYAQKKAEKDDWTKGLNVIPVRLKLKNPAVIDLEGGMINAEAAKLAQKYKDSGKYDGVIFKNAYDTPGPFRPGEERAKATDVAVVFDPSQIRSKFAAFDPEKASSSDLAAGLGGAALLGGAAASSQDAQAAEPEVALQSAMQHEAFNDELQKVLQDRPDLVPVAKKIGLIGD